jgi:hypothetical protein
LGRGHGHSSQAVDRIAVELDEEIRVAVEDACR